MTTTLLVFLSALAAVIVFIIIDMRYDKKYITVIVEPAIYLNKHKKITKIKKRHRVRILSNKAHSTYIQDVPISTILKVQKRKRR